MNERRRPRIGLPAAFGVLPLLSVLGLVGCHAEPPLANVAGQVTQQGQPLSDIVVIFMPEPGQGEDGAISTGRTDSEGRFELSYRGPPARPGAVVGVHRVVLIDPRMEDQRDPKVRPPARLPARYRSAATTPLRCEVRPQRPAFDIQVAVP